MTAFNEYPSVEKLRELAHKPVDLSKEGNLSPKRMKEMVAKNLNLLQQVLFDSLIEKISFQTQVPFFVIHE